jgi:broad specificity phosphatase PhoE
MRKFFIFFLSALFLAVNSWAETRLILVRHGQTDWNKQHRIQGHLDAPLNETGREEATLFSERVIQTYPSIDAIYSSDLERAYATAVITAEKYNMQVLKRTDLREICWGEIEGMFNDDPFVRLCEKRQKELDATNPDRKQRWDVPFAPRAESNNQLLNRFRRELFQIAQNHPDQTVLVFTHGKAIRTLLCDLSDTDDDSFALSNCSMTHISIDLDDKDRPVSFHKIEQFLD